MLDYDKLAQDFEERQAELNEQDTSTTEEGVEALPIMQSPQSTAVAEQASIQPNTGFSSVVGGVQQDILNKAKEKISDDKIVDKHAESLKKIADQALEVQAEQASLTVQEQEADNKVRKQEIKNKLIVLNAEAIRLKKEQEQLNKEQEADHKARNKRAKWELYGDKLTKMGYSYVPNIFVLSMLLFFDGIKSFFDGLGAVSTAIVKALKWFILIGVILAVLFIIPVTREWIVSLLSGGT